jgi:hypothetical protein
MKAGLFLAKAAEFASEAASMLSYDTKTKRFVADYKVMNVVLQEIFGSLDSQVRNGTSSGNTHWCYRSALTG